MSPCTAALFSVKENRVPVAHDKNGGIGKRPYVGYQIKPLGDGKPLLQCSVTGGLNVFTVGSRIAEGKLYFKVTAAAVDQCTGIFHR
jgi:hypothetical protein